MSRAVVLFPEQVLLSLVLGKFKKTFLDMRNSICGEVVRERRRG
jgi:hypothetical protein